MHVAQYNPTWASHLPILIKVFESSTGPVLELGMGVFSTPVLHMLCKSQDRLLVSYELNKKYVDSHNRFASPLHLINHVINWDDIKIEVPWGMVFVDHSPDIRRGIEAGRVANHSQFVVLHDSDPSNDPYYKYPDIYPLFKYRFDYKKFRPHTTVLSNSVDVSKWTL